MASSNSIVRTPACAASGMLAKRISEIAELSRMIGRRDQRSTQAPTGSPISSQGSQVAALSSPT
jgi:hypothetical protein